MVVGRGERVETGSWDSRFDEMLLDVARRSIAGGQAAGAPLPVDLVDYPEPLREIRATFVTLRSNGHLRGCIGALEANLPLVQDVARSAWRAAYHDPRFLPVSREEHEGLDLHVSVLNPAEPMSFASEEELLGQLRPGIDGLIFRDGPAHATFLPDVWESLPEARDFLAHLKQKAGLPTGHWSETVEVRRYTTRGIG